MNTYFYKMILFFFCFLVGVILSSPCLSSDNSGCFKCHKYPGLVRLEKSNNIKAFHIDEKIFSKSVHGKTGCRECHTSVVKIPHTGLNKVGCNIRDCHKNVADISVVEKFSSDRMHQEEHFYLVSIDDNSSCSVCHKIYPHSQNEYVRSILNMHTGFVMCEVCHMNRQSIENLTYDWRVSENAKFNGLPYGNFFKPKNGLSTKNTNNSISRIAPFIIKDNKKIVINSSEKDAVKARDYLKTEKKLKDSEKDKKINYFHRNIHREAVSVVCNECHSENSILDFAALGFDQKKITDLKYLNIKSLVVKYKTFYFPNVFGK